MKAKRILAFSLALATALSAFGCGKDDENKKTTTTEPKKLESHQQEQLDNLAENMENVRQLESSEIDWFSFWDINPTEAEDKEIGADLALFQTKYNGKINYIQTTWEKKFDDLAALVLSNNAPDFIGADDMDIFPKCAIKDMIIPIDDYFDLDDPLWEGTKESADKFEFQGHHYVSVIRNDPSYIVIYNKNTIEENGLDDPAQLFADGEWNWDTFSEMCIEFTNPDEDKYALDGWYYEKAFLQSSGVPLIGIEDGDLVNNIYSETLADVNNMMYDLQKNGVVYPKHDHGWQLRGNLEGNGIGSGLTLFYPIGLWAIEQPPSKTEVYGDIAAGEVMFVPVPNSAESDAAYVPSRVHAFCLVKGGKNPEGVAAYLDCARYCEIDNSTAEITLEQLTKDYGWTQEMIDMRDTIYEMSAENPVFDFEQGVSADLNSICDTAIRGTMNPQEQKTWTSVVEANAGSIDYLLKEAMDSMVKN
ncbi:MAG: extracellular solute-binding protein [Oscillospiraceae bacterium]|nr:extracellular solute-binding protein [Oscillospiraceae bacterium]